MKESQARAVVSLVAAFWPTPVIPSETQQAWTAVLEDQRFGLEDATNGLRLLAENNRFRPAIAEIIGMAEEMWRERMKRDALALPAARSISKGITFTQFIHDNPDMAERVRALDETKPGARLNPIRDALAGLLREGL